MHYSDLRLDLESRIERLKLALCGDDYGFLYLSLDDDTDGDIKFLTMELDALYPQLSVGLTEAQPTTAFTDVDDIVSSVPEVLNFSHKTSSGSHLQEWIATGSKSLKGPTERRYLNDRVPVLGGKPNGVGLFTSSVMSAGKGSWKVFLEAFEPISLVAKPWISWFVSVDPQARIYRVDTASDWYSLVSCFPGELDSSGRVTMSWKNFAVDFDAVHVSSRASFSLEGIPLTGKTPNFTTSPTFWSTETFVWFNSKHLKFIRSERQAIEDA